MPVLVLIGAAVVMVGLAWIEQREEGFAASAAALRLIDAAADAPADAYMPGLFK
jgi:hypothetical protein